jgi:hypothetical protein
MQMASSYCLTEVHPGSRLQAETASFPRTSGCVHDSLMFPLGGFRARVIREKTKPQQATMVLGHLTL